jgi:hypothetical protein
LADRQKQINELEHSKDTDPEKRDKLIDSLVATPVAARRGQPTTTFLDRWASWFGDLFRANDGAA